MSDCIIQIKIGDQVITLDPNSDITPESTAFLTEKIPVSKLRILYSNLKDKVDFDTILQNTDKELALRGETIYSDLVSSAKAKLGVSDSRSEFKDNFISPVTALERVTSPEDKKALSAYIASLPHNEVLTSGNFLEDMKDAYKLSPYTKDMIRSLVFKGSARELELFNQLTASPGLGSLRMSIAVADTFNNKKLTSPIGVYLSPDNIIQILVPATGKYYVIPPSNDADANVDAAHLTPLAVKNVRATMLHELSHAIYSELYQSDKGFKTEINALKQRFLDLAGESGSATRVALANEYRGDAGTHEFLADVFTNTKLQSALNAIVSTDKLYQERGTDSLYKLLVSNLKNTAYQQASSLLKDVLATMAYSMPKNSIVTSFESQAREYVDNPTKENIFFLPDNIDHADVIAHTGSTEQTTSYWTTNARAYWIQSQYLKRLDDSRWSIKDAYYQASTRNPTSAQIDQLYSQDLAVIPWVRYKRSPVEGQSGEWQEVGVLVNKAGKPILKDGEVVDVTRDNNGEVVQNDPRGTIEPRERSLPVVYSSNKTKKVTLAKVGLKNETDQQYNTVAIPYSMIRGIRKFDRSFFDHTHDYDTELTEAKQQLSAAKAASEDEAKFDGTTYWEKQLVTLEAARKLAFETRADIVHTYRAYNFRVKQPDGTVFINETKHPTESTPNPAVFRILDDPSLGKEFARTSSSLPESVSKGDMIQIHDSFTRTVNGEKLTVHGSEWVPVHGKVANGIMVATSKGEGLIIPFHNIQGYAKNTQTESWNTLVSKLSDALADFKNASFSSVSGKRVYNTESIKSTPTTFDPDYIQKNETEEDAITRFSNNLQLAKSRIKPGETFVSVDRTRQDKATRQVDKYSSLEVIVAHTNDGLYTLRKSQTGNVRLEYTRYDQKLDAAKPWGAELLYLKEDVGSVREMYDEYLLEKELFKTNSGKDAFVNEGTKENPKVVPAFDFKANPRNIRDLVDVWEDVDGVKIARLFKGDYVGIKFDKGDNKDLPDFMWRKVVRVLDDGTVVVAEKRRQAFTDQQTGYTDPVKVFPRYISPDDIVRVGYKALTQEEQEDGSFKSELRKDLANRREKMKDYAMRDLEFNDFVFRTADQAQKWNAGARWKDSWHDEYVPLTSHVLNPKSTEPAVFLDRNLKPVDESESAWVKAKFNGDTFSWVLRGMNANTTYFGKDNVTQMRGKTLVLHPDILKELMPGDWIVTEYRAKNGEKKQWHSLIDRIEGGTVYKLMDDNTTQPVNISKIKAIRTSLRNDKYSNFKRNDRIQEVVREIKNSRTSTNKLSLETPYKSPADSQRAIFEIGDRMQSLNPDISLNYVNSQDVKDIFKQTNHDYNDVRAFVLNGTVNINLGKASVSDVIHEYAHLFLHNLKYENTGLYTTLVRMAQNHPAYDGIAAKYRHLTNPDDLNEEVFVTLLGEHMKGKYQNRPNSWMDDSRSKENILNFADYTKDKLNQVLTKEVPAYTLRKEEVLNMQLDEVMNLIGDEVMKSRISDMYDHPNLQFGIDVEKLKKDLKDRGSITEECYG